MFNTKLVDVLNTCRLPILCLKLHISRGLQVIFYPPEGLCNKAFIFFKRIKHHTEFHDSTLNVASVPPTSEVCTAAMLMSGILWNY